MSTVSISYSSLKDASGESKSVARKLNKYADSIESTVYKKLNKYSGDWTNSIYSAQNNANSKMVSLRRQAERYNTYAGNLSDLCDECKRVDKAVKSKVSSLTASFKETHGIRNSKIENAISYFFTSIGNANGVGRWLNDKTDMFRAGTNYLKESIKEWYNYEGGKDLINGILVGLLEVAIGVISIVATILTGGAFLVVLAGVIAGVIAVANGIVNIVNEGRAYNATQNNDPATGKRLSAENTIQDFLRDGDITDETGGGLFGVNNHVNLARDIATGIDITSLCCTVITVVSSCGKLLKNGYKWATGSTSELKDIALKDVFSKEAFSKFGTKIKSGFLDIKKALNFKDWSVVKDFGSKVLSSFKFNLSKSFTNFSDFKGGLSTAKNYLNIAKDLISGKSLFNIAVNKIIIPNIQIFSTHTEGDAKAFNDFFGTDKFNSISIDRISLKDFVDIPKDFCEDIISPLFEKLNAPCSLNISIPDIKVPDMSFNFAV